MYQKALIVFCFIAFDIMTGWVKALATTGYNSSVMRMGMWHKLTEIIACGFCAFCDIALPRIDFVLPVSLFSCIVIYIAIMEITSIIENLGQTFPELGNYLSNVFEKVEKTERKD